MKVKVGAYAAAQANWSFTQMLAFYRELAELPEIAGLELPSSQLEILVKRPELLAGLPISWTYEITTLPDVMTGLSVDREFGLASRSDDGRRSAVAAVERIGDLVQSLHHQLGRAAVTAVTVVSAPGGGGHAPAPSNADAFRTSLDSLMSRPWHGAGLQIEHCDALVAAHPPVKGFLPLEDELSALDAMTDHGIRVIINWARTVIEQRNVHAAVDQAVLARQAGLLAGVVLSGCAASSSEWGEAFADSHLPPLGSSPGGAAHLSLMSETHMAALLRAAGPQVNVGLKVSVRPHTADLATRLQFVSSSLSALRRARSAADSAA